MIELLHAASETLMFSLPFQLLVDVVVKELSFLILFFKYSTLYSGLTVSQAASMVPLNFDWAKKSLSCLMSSSFLIEVPSTSSLYVNILLTSALKASTAASAGSTFTSSATFSTIALKLDSSTLSASS